MDDFERSVIFVSKSLIFHSRTGEIHKISPVLLCLGSDWEVLFARFQPKTGVFVRYLQFIVDFVNFLQDILL